MHRFLRSDLDIVELGSGIGAVSLHLAKAQARDKRLICVEANPYLIDTMRKNFTFNVPWKQVAILNRALDYSGRGRAGLNLDHNLGSHVEAGSNDQLVLVQTVTLKKLLDDFGIGAFALVSDVEGAEAGMILEEAETLSRCRQMIIELHPAVYNGHPYSVDDLCQKIESMHGFALVAHRHGVHVFDKS